MYRRRDSFPGRSGQAGQDHLWGQRRVAPPHSERRGGRRRGGRNGEWAERGVGGTGSGRSGEWAERGVGGPGSGRNGEWAELHFREADCLPLLSFSIKLVCVWAERGVGGAGGGPPPALSRAALDAWRPARERERGGERERERREGERARQRWRESERKRGRERERDATGGVRRLASASEAQFA